MNGHRKVDLFRLYYRMLFSIDSTMRRSEKRIGSLGTRRLQHPCPQLSSRPKP